MERPKQLFRYFSPGAAPMFEDQKFWFSKVDEDFNDIYDVFPSFQEWHQGEWPKTKALGFAFDHSSPYDWKTYNKLVEAGGKEEDRLRRFVSDMPKALLDQVSLGCGVMCFCERGESPLMWSHYTRSHQGFAVEFDPAHPLFNRPSFAKVNYSKKRPSVTARGAKNYNPMSYILTKSRDWDYECEWRMIMAAIDLQWDIRSDKKKRLTMPLPLDAIKGVYLGLRAEPATRERIMKSVAGLKKGQIPVYQMERHPCEFSLIYTPLQNTQNSPGGRDPVRRK